MAFSASTIEGTDGSESDSENPDHLQVKIIATVGRFAQSLGQSQLCSVNPNKASCTLQWWSEIQDLGYLPLPHFLLAIKKVRINISLAKMPHYYMGPLELSCTT